MTATETSTLRVFAQDDGTQPLFETNDGERIAAELHGIGVRFERWSADVHLPAGAEEADVIAAYRGSIDRLMDECGYRCVDVVRVEAEHPNASALRAKFLEEHRHAEDEVRFFVEGCGAFYLHVGECVYQTVCVRGDLIGVPEGTRHWFDMGEHPQFTAIRLFINTDGWVAQFTGDSIAQRIPKLES